MTLPSGPTPLAVPQGEVGVRELRAPKRPWTLPLLVLFLLWLSVLFEPDVWLASHGTLVARKAPLALYALLMALVVTQAADAPRRVWFPPFLLFIVTGSVMVPFAENIGLALDLVWKTLLLYYCLAVGSLTFIKSVERTRLLLVLFLGQFAFWSAQALTSVTAAGSTDWQPIPWHPTLSNTDGFAPLMVMGMVFSYYYGLAAGTKRVRRLAFLTGFLCLIGVVASYTRGATLAAALMVLYVLLRSPRPGKALAWVGIATVVFLIATNVIYPQGEFWTRLASTFSEGTHSGTGGDRWHLWQIGWRIFTEHPLVGVGAGNFGVYAFHNIQPDDMLGRYALNPWFIYGRSLHNIHMEILVEFGLAGVAAYVWMLVDFWKRNAALRSEPFTAAWARATGGRLNLRSVSLGLEGAMVAFLITGFFYDQLFGHWLYSLLVMNALLHATAQRVARASQMGLTGATA